MSLREQLDELVRAGFAGIWIESFEQHDALLEINQLCQDNEWGVTTWDIEQGLRVRGETAVDSGADPLSAVRAVSTMVTPGTASILVLCNFHRFISSAEIVQAMLQQLQIGKQYQCSVVVLAPSVNLPVELDRLFTVIHHELPSKEQVAEIARGVAQGDELPTDNELDRVLDAASGLTRIEAENAFSLSIVRHDRLEPEPIWQLKAQSLLKSGLLSLHRGGESFDQLGGLESLKAFARRALRPRSTNSRSPRARGILLLGVPGTGKSQFAKSLGSEVARPVLVLDVGSLMGSLVGQSEERTRTALRIVDAMQPAVLFIDEVEKALSGIQGQGDSGVASRMFGHLLGWLNDHESDVFVICTANDVTRLPPEFSRSERFDATFFLDLPGNEQRQRIWDIYLAVYQLEPGQPKPDDTNWTGAEIKSCCRLAALLDLPLTEAALNVVPVAVTAAERVDELRTWASGRCLSSDSPGLYSRAGGTHRSRHRRIDPSVN